MHSDLEQTLSALMRQAQEGNEKAYREVLVIIERLLLTHLRRSLPTAFLEDVSQEIIFSIHLKRHTFNSEQRILPWIFAIAKHKVIDHFRSSGRIRKELDYAIDVDRLAQDEVSWYTESLTAENFNKILSALPSKQRKIIKLVKVEGLSIKETASHLELSESDVKMNIHRAINFLKLRAYDR